MPPTCTNTSLHSSPSASAKVTSLILSTGYTARDPPTERVCWLGELLTCMTEPQDETGQAGRWPWGGCVMKATSEWGRRKPKRRSEFPQNPSGSYVSTPVAVPLHQPRGLYQRPHSLFFRTPGASSSCDGRRRARWRGSPAAAFSPAAAEPLESSY